MVKANALNPKISTRMHLANDISGKSKSQKNSYSISMEFKNNRNISTGSKIYTVCCLGLHILIWWSHKAKDFQQRQDKKQRNYKFNARMLSRGKQSAVTEHLTHTHTHTHTRGVRREEMKGGHEEVGCVRGSQAPVSFCLLEGGHTDAEVLF